MLTDEMVAEINQLLKSTTISQRAIARRLGINRETVNRIANGARFDPSAHRRAKEALEPRDIEPIRCHGCGSKITVIPCLTCKLRKMDRQGRAARRFAESWQNGMHSLGVDLLPPDRERYEAIRAQKIRRGERPASNACLTVKYLVDRSRGMPASSSVKYLRWFIAHPEKLTSLLALPNQLRRAATQHKKWELLKEAGDLVLRVVEQHPVREVAQVCAMGELRREVETKGISWEKLIDLLPALVDLVDIVQGRRLED